MQSKDRVLDAFVNFQNYATNHFNAKIKFLRTDNGGEYIGNAFKAHLTKHGIIHQTTCPYTPQQNGVAERKNRHLMEVARSMMFHACVPKRFWGDAVLTACYLINRTPTKVLDDVSPYEVLNKLKPSIHHLKIFGCVCYVLIPGELRNKLQAKSTKAMFIGYSTTQKGWKCYDPVAKRVLVSKDVQFVEHKAYFDSTTWNELKGISNSHDDRATILRNLLEGFGISIPKDNIPPPKEVPSTPEMEAEPQSDHEGGNEEDVLEEQEPTEHDQNEELNDSEESEESEQEQEQSTQEEVLPVQELRRGTRLRRPASNWINTRVFFNGKAVAYPIENLCSITHLPKDHQAFISKIDEQSVPRTYTEAIQKKEWRDAIDNETKAMEDNGTWLEADLPKGKKAVTSKWVFTIKHRSDGEIERYKARLVARGFTQTYGEDYLDTFAPVAKLHSVRIILALATNLRWELWQMDVKNAFLQGELEEEVYMHPPDGLKDIVQPGKVLRLKKAIYGLKQSPRAWYHKLSSTLIKKGFKRSEADHSLFNLSGPQGSIVILVYVDDIIITGSDKAGILNTKLFLMSIFSIKDLGTLKYFLGIEICQSKEGLFLSQRKYTLDLLTEAGKLGAKPAKTPLEEGYKIMRTGEVEEKAFEDPKQYRRLVGKLIYLTITRPDICFAVNQVSQHMHAPMMHHWHMVERILRYLKGSPSQGIWMKCNGRTDLVGYCDADWAGDRNDRKSTTGYCTFIGGSLVTWKSKKQKVISCSSAEAEYRAMRKLTNELIWIAALLNDLGIKTKTPIPMHCDNQAAIHIASNSVFHERTKHIEIDCHKVRPLVEKGFILPCYTKSEDQLADIFTKAASCKVCDSIHRRLGLSSGSGHDHTSSIT